MINFGIDIPNYIECPPNSMYVKIIEYGDRKSRGGLYLMKEQMDYEGHFAHPRWAQVVYKADNIKDIEIGDYIALDHGHWTTSMKMFINGNEETLWYVSPKSYKKGLIAMSKVMPSHLVEYLGE